MTADAARAVPLQDAEAGGGGEMRRGRIKRRGGEGELLDTWGLGRGLGHSVDVETLGGGFRLAEDF